MSESDSSLPSDIWEAPKDRDRDHLKSSKKTVRLHKKIHTDHVQKASNNISEDRQRIVKEHQQILKDHKQRPCSTQTMSENRPKESQSVGQDVHRINSSNSQTMSDSQRKVTDSVRRSNVPDSVRSNESQDKQKGSSSNPHKAGSQTIADTRQKERGHKKGNKDIQSASTSETISVGDSEKKKSKHKRNHKEHKRKPSSATSTESGTMTESDTQMNVNEHKQIDKDRIQTTSDTRTVTHNQRKATETTRESVERATTSQERGKSPCVKRIPPALSVPTHDGDSVKSKPTYSLKKVNNSWIMLKPIRVMCERLDVDKMIKTDADRFLLTRIKKSDRVSKPWTRSNSCIPCSIPRRSPPSHRPLTLSDFERPVVSESDDTPKRGRSRSHNKRSHKRQTQISSDEPGLSTSSIVEIDSDWLNSSQKPKAQSSRRIVSTDTDCNAQDFLMSSLQKRKNHKRRVIMSSSDDDDRTPEKIIKSQLSGNRLRIISESSDGQSQSDSSKKMKRSKHKKGKRKHHLISDVSESNETDWSTTEVVKSSTSNHGNTLVVTADIHDSTSRLKSTPAKLQARSDETTSHDETQTQVGPVTSTVSHDDVYETLVDPVTSTKENVSHDDLCEILTEVEPCIPATSSSAATKTGTAVQSMCSTIPNLQDIGVKSTLQKLQPTKTVASVELISSTVEPIQMCTSIPSSMNSLASSIPITTSQDVIICDTVTSTSVNTVPNTVVTMRQNFANTFTSSIPITKSQDVIICDSVSSMSVNTVPSTVVTMRQNFVNTLVSMMSNASCTSQVNKQNSSCNTISPTQKFVNTVPMNLKQNIMNIPGPVTPRLNISSISEVEKQHLSYNTISVSSMRTSVSTTPSTAIRSASNIPKPSTSTVPSAQHVGNQNTCKPVPKTTDIIPFIRDKDIFKTDNTLTRDKNVLKPDKPIIHDKDVFKTANIAVADDRNIFKASSSTSPLTNKENKKINYEKLWEKYQPKTVFQKPLEVFESDKRIFNPGQAWQVKQKFGPRLNRFQHLTRKQRLELIDRRIERSALKQVKSLTSKGHVTSLNKAIPMKDNVTTTNAESNGKVSTTNPESNGKVSTTNPESNGKVSTTNPESNGKVSTTNPESNGKVSTTNPESNGKVSTTNPESNGKVSTTNPESNGKVSTTNPESNGKVSTTNPESNGKVSKTNPDSNDKVMVSSTCALLLPNGLANSSVNQNMSENINKSGMVSEKKTPDVVDLSMLVMNDNTVSNPNTASHDGASNNEQTFINTPKDSSEIRDISTDTSTPTTPNFQVTNVPETSDHMTLLQDDNSSLNVTTVVNYSIVQNNAKLMTDIISPFTTDMCKEKPKIHDMIPKPIEQLQVSLEPTTGIIKKVKSMPSSPVNTVITISDHESSSNETNDATANIDPCLQSFTSLLSSKCSETENVCRSTINDVAIMRTDVSHVKHGKTDVVEHSDINKLLDSNEGNRKESQEVSKITTSMLGNGTTESIPSLDDNLPAKVTFNQTIDIITYEQRDSTNQSTEKQLDDDVSTESIGSTCEPKVKSETSEKSKSSCESVKAKRSERKYEDDEIVKSPVSDSKSTENTSDLIKSENLPIKHATTSNHTPSYSQQEIIAVQSDEDDDIFLTQMNYSVINISDENDEYLSDGELTMHSVFGPEMKEELDSKNDVLLDDMTDIMKKACKQMSEGDLFNDEVLMSQSTEESDVLILSQTKTKEEKRVSCDSDSMVCDWGDLVSPEVKSGNDEQITSQVDNASGSQTLHTINSNQTQSGVNTLPSESLGFDVIDEPDNDAKVDSDAETISDNDEQECSTIREPSIKSRHSTTVSSRSSSESLHSTLTSESKVNILHHSREISDASAVVSRRDRDFSPDIFEAETQVDEDSQRFTDESDDDTAERDATYCKKSNSVSSPTDILTKIDESISALHRNEQSEDEKLQWKHKPRTSDDDNIFHVLTQVDRSTNEGVEHDDLYDVLTQTEKHEKKGKSRTCSPNPYDDNIFQILTQADCSASTSRNTEKKTKSSLHDDDDIFQQMTQVDSNTNTNVEEDDKYDILTQVDEDNKSEYDFDEDMQSGEDIDHLSDEDDAAYGMVTQLDAKTDHVSDHDDEDYGIATQIDASTDHLPDGHGAYGIATQIDASTDHLPDGHGAYGMATQIDAKTDHLTDERDAAYGMATQIDSNTFYHKKKPPPLKLPEHTLRSIFIEPLPLRKKFSRSVTSPQKVEKSDPTCVSKSKETTVSSSKLGTVSKSNNTDGWLNKDSERRKESSQKSDVSHKPHKRRKKDHSTLSQCVSDAVHQCHDRHAVAAAGYHKKSADISKTTKDDDTLGAIAPTEEEARRMGLPLLDFAGTVKSSDSSTSLTSLFTTTTTSTSGTLSKTTASSTLSKTTASSTLSKTTASSTLSKTTASSTLLKTTASGTLSKATASGTLSKTTASGTLSKTTASATLSKTTANVTLPKTTASRLVSPSSVMSTHFPIPTTPSLTTSDKNKSNDKIEGTKLGDKVLNRTTNDKSSTNSAKVIPQSEKYNRGNENNEPKTSVVTKNNDNSKKLSDIRTTNPEPTVTAHHKYGNNLVVKKRNIQPKSLIKQKPSTSQSSHESTFYKEPLANANIQRKKPVHATDSRSAVTSAVTSAVNSGGLIRSITEWMPRWFVECEEFLQNPVNKIAEPPPVDGPNKPQLPLFIDTPYRSYDDYHNMTKYLLLLEVWEVLFEEYRTSNEKFPPIQIVCREESAQPGKAAWCGIITKEMSDKDMFPHTNDIVILVVRQPKNQPNDGKELKSVIGYVEDMRIRKCEHAQREFTKFPILKKVAQEKGADCKLITITVFMSHKRIPKVHVPDPHDFSYIKVIGNLATFNRQYNALVSLRPVVNCEGKAVLSRIMSALLDPQSHPQVFREQVVLNQENLKASGLNESQHRAVLTATKMMMDPPLIARVALIQGPPGTGKTRVIYSIACRILKLKPSAHILVCAHSNGAVDEVTRRFIYYKVNKGGEKVLRLGRTSVIAQDVRECSFEESFKRKREKRNRDKTTLDDSVGQEMIQLCTKDKALQEDLKKAQSDNDTSKALSIKAELKKIQQQKQCIMRSTPKLSKSEQHDTHRSVMCGASIVCCTLSFTGGREFDFDKIYTDKSKPFFYCVIIDEATQCTELDCLIPLQNGIKKMILVGDHEQLPATIKSRKAAELNYSQSLFERLHNTFKSLPAKDNPIQFLDTQYRMHREICAFPSKHIYLGRLKCYSEDQKYHQFCHPYLVFDLPNSTETNNGTGGIHNAQEVEFVLQLFDAIHKQFRRSDCGIISPYSEHNAQIISQLKSRNLGHVDVNTVDGFQGREKPVIVFSCVRAANTVGFMYDRRRINVALTRAKNCLYIVGNLNTLVRDENWKALIDDAHERKCIVRVPSVFSYPKAIERCFKPQR